MVCSDGEVRSVGAVNIYVNRVEGRGRPGRGERHLVKQETVVHRHSLDRLNTINDFKKKKKLRTIARGRPGRCSNCSLICHIRRTKPY